MNLTNDLVQTVVYKTDEDGNQILGLDGQPIAIGVDVQFVLADGSVTGKVYLPYGQNGADGVGIASVKRENVVDENGRVLKTIFSFVKTDNTELGPFEIINGFDGVGVKDVSYDLLEDGRTMVHVHLTDGSIKSFYIPAALSIKEIIRTEDDKGNVTLTIHYTDPEKEPLTVSLQGARGITGIESSESADGTKYILKITYTDGNTQTVDFSKNSAWHNGKNDPKPDLGIAGDYYFDQWNRSIWFKEPNLDTNDPLDGTWIEIVDFHSFNQEVKIRFELNKSLDEDWDENNTLLLTRDYYETTLKVGQSFASTGKELPIPYREGYEFLGWYKTDAPNLAIHGAFTDMTVIPNTTSMTLHAAWRPLITTP